MLQSPSLRQNLMTNDAYQFLRRELERWTNRSWSPCPERTGPGTCR